MLLYGLLHLAGVKEVVELRAFGMSGLHSILLPVYYYVTLLLYYYIAILLHDSMIIFL